MTEKLLDFSDLAKQEYQFLIEDICYAVNNYGMHEDLEENLINHLMKVLELRKQYAIGREGFAHVDDKRKPKLSLLKGGK